MTMQSHIQQESPRKKIGFKLVCSTQPTIFSGLYAKGFLFCSLQNALNDKKFSQEDQVKMFM